tara:strand:- start:5238 stop:6044 length:807 start_codon:yes stop_codon:yes gene_type:complete
MNNNIKSLKNTSSNQTNPIHFSAQGIMKKFGGIDALNNINFELNRGEVMGLVGDNGAGKSTLMKAISGAQLCDSGSFFIDGKEVKITSPQEASLQGIQIVYQDLALCENLDVTANLFLGNEIRYFDNLKIIPKALKPLNHLSMEEQTKAALKKLKVHTITSMRTKIGFLSGGQRQSIAIARAILSDSSIVLLDEPTAALGVSQTKEVLELVKRLRETNHAVVLISHNLNNIFEVCDRITVMRQGENIGTFSAKNTTPDQIVSYITRGK